MVHNLQTLKKVCILLMLASLPGLSFAQQLARTGKPLDLISKQDTEKNMVPLVKVLEELEERFKVHFNFDSELLEDKMVKESSGAKEEDIEKALQQVLGPLNLRFERFQKSQKNYLIFQKITPQTIKKLESRRGLETDRHLMVKKHLDGFNLPEIKPNRILQEITVTGKVTAADEGSLPGVNIVEKGTTNGTVTDIDGNYRLEVNGNATLVFSSVGYETVELPVGNRSVINLEMETDVQQLQEIVVVGFGRQSSMSVTGAISSIKSEDIETTSAVTMGDALTGRLPGIVTVQPSSQPGVADPTLLLRGLGTLNSNDPLIIIDGVPNTMRAFMQLSPNNIENISILKDASSTAVYGVRGANGVIIVDTKSGVIGKTSIRAEVSYGLQTPTYLPDYLGSYDWSLAYNEALENDGATEGFIPDYHLERFRLKDQPLIFPDVNWMDVTMNNAAAISRNNIDISGGTEDIQYFGSVAYLKQDGLLTNFANATANTTYDRFNIRANLKMKITPSTTLDFRSSARIGVRKEPMLSFNNDLSLFYDDIGTTPPMSTVGIVDGRFIKPDGDLYHTYSNNENPIGSVIGQGYHQTRENRVDFNLDLRQKMEVISPYLQGLEFRTRVGYRTGYNERIRNDGPGFTTYTSLYNIDASNPIPDLADSAIVYQVGGLPGISSFNHWYQNPARYIYMETGLDYERGFGPHTVRGLFLFNLNKDYYPNLAFSNIPTANMGMVGRLVYDFQQKYIVEFNLGYNGSENFAKGKRFGLFPSFSGSWVISNEPFMQNVTFIDYLKLRGSYGIVGSDEAGRRARFIYIGDRYDRNVSKYYGYNFGNNVPQYLPGVHEASIGNEDVTWETAKKQNYGIDLKFFSERLSFNGDYFYEYRDNILLYPQSAPGFLAIDLPPLNIGVMENEGFELNLTWQDDIGDFSYMIGGNITRAENTVLNLDEINPPEPYQSRTGRSLNLPYGYIYEGFYTPDEVEIIKEEREQNVAPQNRTYPIPFADVEAGDMKYKDMNGDGSIDSKDETVFGYPDIPQVLGGLNMAFGFRGFDLTLGFQGAAEVSRNISGIYRDAFGGQNDQGVWAPLYEGRWTLERFENGEDIIFPRLTFQNDAYNREGSSFWNRDASYLRLKNAELGYSFDERTFSAIGVKRFRIYLRGLNLITWQKNEYRWFDPEKEAQSRVRTFYPNLRIVTAGINVQF